MATSNEQNDLSNEPKLLQLRRFLYLGDEFHSFPKSVKYPFSPEKTQLLKDLDEINLGIEALTEVARAHRNGNYLGFETLIHALVILGHSPNFSTKSKALKTACEICTSASMMLTFAHFYKDISKPGKGWGRAHRKFLIKWYSEKDAKDLAVEVTKTKSCHNWTHKDVLCMAHVKAEHSGNAAVLKYLVKGLEVADNEYGSDPDAAPILNYLKGVYELCHTTDPETAARLIEVHNLCLEHIPSKLLKWNEVERKGTVDGYEWRCRNQSKDNRHDIVRSVRKGTWFSESKLAIIILRLTRYWFGKSMNAFVVNDLKVNKNRSQVGG
ncbi:hypothetical protein TNCV_1765431 [Trichonephila clavipes]|nr:hypothetical protein TNCV_1765431 [Trichonephila clavipes]